MDILLRLSFDSSAKMVFTGRLLDRLHAAVLFPDGGRAYISLWLR